MKQIKDSWPWWKRAGAMLKKPRRKAFRLFKLFPDLRYEIIVDLGAYHGEFTDAACEIMNPKRVILIEADPVSAARLSEKYEGNARCSVVHAAVTDHCGHVTFRINAHRDSSSVLPISDKAEAIFGKEMAEVEEVEVRAVTLDELFALNGLSKVDLLKVDIQGAEHLMISGGKKALSMVRALYIEVCFERYYEGSKTFPELDALLREEGFKLRSFDEPRLGTDDCMAYANALYLRVGVAEPASGI